MRYAVRSFISEAVALIAIVACAGLLCCGYLVIWTDWQYLGRMTATCLLTLIASCIALNSLAEEKGRS